MLSFFLFGKFSGSIDLPKWPQKYRLSGVWRIPYQKLNQPFTVYTDNVNLRQYEDVYNGLQRTITFLNEPHKQYQLQPNIDHISCIYADGYFPENASLVEYLPTNNTEYQYKGETITLGRRCHMWEKIVTPVENARFNWTYRFYADYETLEPVQIWNHGASIRESHPTDYYYDIYDFGPTIQEDAFVYPPNCLLVDTSGPSFARDLGLRKGKATNDDYCRIKEITTEVNLPENFSWRTVPNILSMPRDQANCGSCWAEGGAVAISSAISMRLNKSVQISVQQIVDCAWDDTNHACQGGETNIAFRTLINRNVSFAYEDDYPYLGVGGYCSPTTASRVARLTDCWQVTPNNKEQLQKALYINGPLAVAIAADTPFQHWQGPEAYSGPDTLQPLNHVVTLTGWKVINGVFSWEIQNSWSDTWGMDGYGYIDGRDFVHDIGITQNVYVPVIELVEQ